MPVQVRDVLEVPSLAGAELLCGRSGLGREVRRVSAVDASTSPEDDVLSAAGDLYLTSLYAVRSQPEDIAAYMEDFVRTEAAAVVVIDEFVPRLPVAAVRLCEAAGLPVLMLDRHVPYAAVIAEVMELVLLDRQSALDTQRVAVVRDPGQPAAVRMQALRELAPGLRAAVSAVYVSGREARALAGHPSGRRERRHATYIGMPDGVLILVDAGEGTEGADGHPEVQHVVDAVRAAVPSARVGVSTPALPLALAGRAIDEAWSAATGAHVLGRAVARFPELGMLRVVLAMRDDPELAAMANSVLGPLRERDDARRSGALSATVRAYLASGRSIPATARACFVHDNTVRYRLGLARDLLREHTASPDPLDDVAVALLADAVLAQAR